MWPRWHHADGVCTMDIYCIHVESSSSISNLFCVANLVVFIYILWAQTDTRARVPIANISRLSMRLSIIEIFDQNILFWKLSFRVVFTTSSTSSSRSSGSSGGGSRQTMNNGKISKLIFILFLFKSNIIPRFKIHILKMLLFRFLDDVKTVTKCIS